MRRPNANTASGSAGWLQSLAGSVLALDHPKIIKEPLPPAPTLRSCFHQAVSRVAPGPACQVRVYGVLKRSFQFSFLVGTDHCRALPVVLFVCLYPSRFLVDSGAICAARIAGIPPHNASPELSKLS